MFLVTGGYGGTYLSFTETLVDGAGTWKPAGPLPVAMSGLRGVSLNNNILMSGDIVINYPGQIHDD